MSSKNRVHSNWRSITILSDDGKPFQIFPIDETGRLNYSFPRNKRRILIQNDSTNESLQSNNTLNSEQSNDQNVNAKKEVKKSFLPLPILAEPFNEVNLDSIYNNDSDYCEMCEDFFEDLFSPHISLLN